MTKQVVFVQGGKANEAAFPWMFFHLDPFTDVDPGPVELVFFDYPAGKRKTWKKWTVKRGRAAPLNPDSEDDLLPKVKIRLDDGSLDTGPEKPSVLALYEFVKKQKGSIISLQVFSHGWEGGPIIWDSSEFGPGGVDIDHDLVHDRDPNDTDFRARDFFGKNPLAGAEGQKFVAAFAPGALIKLWGCVAPRGVRRPVQNFKHSPKTDREKAANDAHVKDYTDSIEESFAFIMARQLKLPVWAAPLGWGSDPGSTIPISGRRRLKVTYRGTFPPDLTKDHWWRVSWFFRNQDRGAKFYKDVLKARVDATDFVEYKESWFDDARRTAGVFVIPTPQELSKGLQDAIDAAAAAISGGLVR